MILISWWKFKKSKEDDQMDNPRTYSKETQARLICCGAVSKAVDAAFYIFFVF